MISLALDKMTKFRPCIDLHAGQVKQIVGGSLRDDGSAPRENFVSNKSAAWFAELYRDDALCGGHVICLGKGNDEAAREALTAWRGGMQIGGGIHTGNAESWLSAGASHVIITSMLFDESGIFQNEKLRELVEKIGAEKIVIDLSCRRTKQGWTVAMNRWQTLTNLDVTHEVLDMLSQSCDEFLIHAADVEGLCQGIDEDLVKLLGSWAGKPMTYAGGVAKFSDVELVNSLSKGNVDVTVGSALDIFGGSGVKYVDLVEWNKKLC